MTILRQRLGDIDNSSVDASSNLRVSSQSLMFSSNFHNDTLIGSWDSNITGVGASVIHDSINKVVNMTVGTVLGEKVIRHTRRFLPFQLGRAHLIKITNVIGVAKTGVLQKCGIYDDDNGLRFEQDETGISIVIHSAIAPTVVIPQADWNADKLDGTGSSGNTLDFSKIQTLVFDIQNINYGRIKFGVETKGIINYCHVVDNLGIDATKRFSEQTLPIRMEIENVATTVSSTTMIQVGAIGVSEGGNLDFSFVGNVFSASNGVITKPVTEGVLAPFLTIRVKDLFNGVKNRISVIPLLASLFSKKTDIFWRCQLNAQLTGAAFVDVDPTSGVEADTSATAIATPGRTIIEGYMEKKSSLITDNFKSLLVMTSGDSFSDALTFEAAGLLTGGGDCAVGVQWKEII